MVRADGKPVNDNLAAANDNRRTDYMRNYMARRRNGGKTIRQLLREGLDCLVARASPDDQEAQTFIAAVKDILGPENRAKGGGR
jgi:hypothetical protein